MSSQYFIWLCEFVSECPKPVDVLAIVLGVVLGIVFVGLALLLIWKLLTTIQDRRELASFEKERKNAKWDTVSQLPQHKSTNIICIAIYHV